MRKIFKTKWVWVLILFGISLPAVAQVSDNKKGRVQFELNEEEVFIIIDDDFKNAHRYSKSIILELPAGERQITIAHPDANNFNYKLQVPSDSIIVSRINLVSFKRNPRSSYKILDQGWNVSIETEPLGDIYLNDEWVGTGSAQVLAEPGKLPLRVEHPEYGTLSKTITVSKLNEANLRQYNKNHDPIAMPLRFLPGGGYFNNKQKYKASITFVTLGMLGFLYYDLNRSYNDLNDSFEANKFNYYNAKSLSKADLYRNAANDDLEQLKTKNNQIKYTLIGMGAAYLITTLDGFRKPKEGYKTSPRDVDKFDLSITSNYQNTLSLTFSIDF